VIKIEKTYLPGIGKRNDMVDVEVTSSSPGLAIIWRDPCTTGSSTVIILDHIGAVSLQNNLARVTATIDTQLDLPCNIVDELNASSYLPWEIQ